MAMAIAIYQRGASLHATWHDRRPHIPLLKQTLLGAKLSDEITQDSRGHPRLFTYSGYRKIRNAHYEDKDNDMPSCRVVSVGKVHNSCMESESVWLPTIFLIMSVESRAQKKVLVFTDRYRKTFIQ